MKEKKICSCFGHRLIDITEELYATAAAAIHSAVDFGCCIFYFGGFGEFDQLCYNIISSIKTSSPELEIERVFCVPTERMKTRGSPSFNRENYERIVYLQPAFSGWYKSIYYRNCAMIDDSDLVIFYAEARNNSGAYKAYKYAKRKKKKIINLWDPHHSSK